MLGYPRVIHATAGFAVAIPMGGATGASFGVATSPHRPTSIALNTGAIDGFAIASPMGDAIEAILGRLHHLSISLLAPPLAPPLLSPWGDSTGVDCGVAVTCPNRYIGNHQQRRGQSD